MGQIEGAFVTYAEFKDYIARFVWRDGDTPFEAELDNLIKMGEARLNRDLRIQRMTKVYVEPLSADEIVLPADYQELRTVTSSVRPAPLQYVALQELERLRAAKPNRFLGAYSISGNTIVFAGADAADGREIRITYYAKVPDFKTDDASWLADEYLDLYTYAVLRHTASYLRDDDRVALWQNEYAETLMSVMDDETKRRFAGSPLTVRLPGNVA